MITIWWWSTITTDTSDPDTVRSPIGGSDAAVAELPDGIVSENERPVAAVRAEGVVRADGDDRRRADVPVALVATDRRVLFVPAAGDGEVGGLPYSALTGVTVDDGTCVLRDADGVEIRVPVETPGREPIPHLRWVGDIRERVLAARSDADLAAGAIRSAAEEADHAEALETYDSLRDRLDRLTDAVHRAPLDAGVLAPELTGIEQILEAARTRLDAQRARSRAELARQLATAGDYGRAERVLGEARDLAAVARGRAAAVGRGDGFRFGEHRALADAVGALEWALAAAAAEPLRRADEALLRARSAAEPGDALEWWETALDRYDSLVATELGPGEGTLSDRRRAAVEGTIAARVECARRAWNAGADADPAEAAGPRRAARAHLDRALAVATDRGGPVEPLRARRERVVAALRRTRMAGLAAGRLDRAGGDEGDAPARGLPTAREIERIDTHQEIGYDLDPDGSDGADPGCGEPTPAIEGR